MYTRFKSQKSGLKLGLNNIANNRKVVAPSSNMASSVCSTISTSSSNLSLNSNEPKSQKTSGETSPIYSPPSSIINSVMSVSSILVDDNNNSVSNATKVDTTIIPFKYNDDDEKNNKYFNGKKHEQNETMPDDLVDPTCISYVKTMWDKYSSEIGTQNGPLKHVDEHEEYPHLDGFVAFDMEHWWAERSISSMIKQSSDKNKITDDKEINTDILMTNTDPLLNATLKKSSFKMNNKLHSTNNQQIHSMQNFNICFS